MHVSTALASREMRPWCRFKVEPGLMNPCMGRGAPRQARSPKRKAGWKRDACSCGVSAPCLVTPPAGLSAQNQDQKTVSPICPWFAGFTSTVERLCAVRLANEEESALLPSSIAPPQHSFGRPTAKQALLRATCRNLYDLLNVAAAILLAIRLSIANASHSIEVGDTVMPEPPHDDADSILSLTCSSSPHNHFGKLKPKPDPTSPASTPLCPTRYPSASLHSSPWRR
jgi:hypothetical protein